VAAPPWRPSTRTPRATANDRHRGGLSEGWTGQFRCTTVPAAGAPPGGRAGGVEAPRGPPAAHRLAITIVAAAYPSVSCAVLPGGQAALRVISIPNANIFDPFFGGIGVRRRGTAPKSLDGARGGMWYKPPMNTRVARRGQPCKILGSGHHSDRSACQANQAFYLGLGGGVLAQGCAISG